MTSSGAAGTTVVDFAPDGTTLDTVGGVAVALVGQSAAAHGSNNADTTSNTHVLIEGAGNTEQMTITPGAGTWLVLLSVQCTVTGAPETIEIALYVGGVEAGHNRIGRRVAAGADIGASGTHDLLVVGAGEAVEGRFRSVGGAGVRITSRHLSAIRAS